MEKKYRFTANKPAEDSFDFDDCSEMFQEGYSDFEISKELGINENYIKKLREEFLRDY